MASPDRIVWWEEATCCTIPGSASRTVCLSTVHTIPSRILGLGLGGVDDTPFYTCHLLRRRSPGGMEGGDWQGVNGSVHLPWTGLDRLFAPQWYPPSVSLPLPFQSLDVGPCLVVGPDPTSSCGSREPRSKPMPETQKTRSTPIRLETIRQPHPWIPSQHHNQIEGGEERTVDRKHRHIQHTKTGPTSAALPNQTKGRTRLESEKKNQRFTHTQTNKNKRKTCG